MSLDDRDRLFVSYSHREREWKDRLKTAIKPYLRGDPQAWWDDTEIRAGEHWQDKIDASLRRAKVAVLLVSREFLASDFIVSNELPPLLEAAQASGVTIAWVAVGHSAYEQTALKDYQAVNSPEKPLMSLDEDEVDKELDQISKEIVKLLYDERHSGYAPSGTAAEASGGINHILDAVRKQLLSQVDKVVTEMRETGQCTNLPLPIFYAIKEYAVGKVPEYARVRAINLLHLREWKHQNFSLIYLYHEATAIQVNHIKVERFFVGTVEDIESSTVRKLIQRNIGDGVTVRRVYIGAETFGTPGFDRDIAFHETEPACVTEGLYDQGYLVNGKVTTNEADVKNMSVFENLERYSPELWTRSPRDSEIADRSRQGWERYYAANVDRGAEAEPSPVLVQNQALESHIRRLYGNRGDADRKTFNLVEASCGAGRNITYCREVIARLSEDPLFFGVRFDITGVDFSEFVVRMAIERVGNGFIPAAPIDDYVKWRVLQRDFAEDVASISDQVDFLFCTDGFSHIHPNDVPHALTEWRRVLRPKGTILFNAYRLDRDSIEGSEEEAMAGHAGGEKDDQFGFWWRDNRIYKFYDRDEIRDAVFKAGLVVNDIREMEFEVPPYSRSQSQGRLGRHWIIDATKQ